MAATTGAWGAGGPAPGPYSRALFLKVLAVHSTSSSSSSSNSWCGQGVGEREGGRAGRWRAERAASDGNCLQRGAWLLEKRL
eukprot:811690-Pelagomonas_calceolata.AAC.1